MLRIIGAILILLGLGASALGVLGMVSPGGSETPEPPVMSAPPPPGSQPLMPGSEPGDEPIVRTQSSTETAFLAQLRRLPIAHEAPTEARFGAAFPVTLAIDATGADSAVGALAGSGNIIQGEARLGSQARARLVGAGFDIEALSPEDQAISTLTANTWRWSVTPREAGQHDLVMEIFALEGGLVMPVRTYRETITVEVSTLRQAIDFAQSANPLAMLLGGIGSVIGGLATAARFFRR